MGAEHAEKLERVARVAHAADLHGVLLAGHHNIAWLTSGRANRIDASRETGSARLLVAADGRRFVLANAIEMPRLLDEELAGLGYEPVEYPWTEDQDPSRAVRAARRMLGDGVPLGSDWPLPGTTVVEAALARARGLLTDGDIARYRTLGREAGLMLGNVCRELTPGDEERDIARTIMDGALALRARPIVTLVGSDERLRRYRHPVPSAAAWKSVVMVALCAERGRRSAGPGGSHPRDGVGLRASARRHAPGHDGRDALPRRRRRLRGGRFSRRRTEASSGGRDRIPRP